MIQHKAFSCQNCEELLLQLAAVREAGRNTNRQAIEVKRDGSYIVMGLFSHGNMSGITRKTHELPQLCRYLNLFGRFQLHGTCATWTSFTININQAARVHMDPNNDPNSHNYTCSFGAFTGGELWTELTESSDQGELPVRWKARHNGQRVPGHLHNTRHQFVKFDPKGFHAVDRWKGLRISLTFYTSRLITQATPTRRKCLQQYGFPVPRLRAREHEESLDLQLECDEPSSIMLSQDDRQRLQTSCEEVWAEVDQLLDSHGRDDSRVQVMEFGGPHDRPLCAVLERQGCRAQSLSLSKGYDLGTRGGFSRALLQLREFQPQLAWFQVPKGPQDPLMKDPTAVRSLPQRFQRVVKHLLALSESQLKHGDCVWISEKSSSIWRNRGAQLFWENLDAEGRAFEWSCGLFRVRTTSQVMYMECSRPCSTTMPSQEQSASSSHRLYAGLAASLTQVHGSIRVDPEEGHVCAIQVDKECLKGVTKAELEALLDTVQKLHRKFGHPPNSLLCKNLRARGASPKLLAVAAEFKCDVCLENQIKSSRPAVSLHREDRLWCTLQIDGFYMRMGNEVFHYVLMVDEASGFCMIEEMMRHPDSQMRQMTTAQVCRVLETRWFQIFGFPENIKLDPEGAFRGLELREYCLSRGVELLPVPAEFHEGISEVERTIGTIRRKVETFMRQEQYHPTRAAAQMVAAHNSLARSSGWSPVQWAFGREVTNTGHSRERPGEVCAQSAMSDPTHSMHESLQLRTRAEKAFLEYRERELLSRASNSKTRPVKQFLPGDLIFYQRYQVPQDTPANSVVDRPRLQIARFYGPARVLATETRVDHDDNLRRPGTIIWAVCSGRLKKFHHSQVRHASETERLIVEGAQGLAFPWTFSALSELLEKGAYDDETKARFRPERGRSRTPARSRSVPPASRRRLDEPEPPVPPRPLSARGDSDLEGEEELIPVPAEQGEKRGGPESGDEEMELLPEPPVPSASSASSPDMVRFMSDPTYFPDSFAVLSEDAVQDFVHDTSDGEDDHASQDLPAFAVTLPAPASEQEWKAIVKNPKRFVAKSVQKGVEVSYAKLNPQQRAAMDSAKSLEVENWLRTVAVRAAKKFVPQRELLKMHWVLTFKSSGEEESKDQRKSGGEQVKAKARIVILGYSDPNLLDATTVSPSMSRLSRQLLLNMVAVKKWELICGDVKSAFLQAKSPQEARGVFAAPVEELSAALQLRPGQCVQLLKSCYGLVSAPREWYDDVHRTLSSLGAERLISDACVWRVKDESGQVVGLISSHVDDFLMGGSRESKVWSEFLHKFKSAYEWSPWQYSSFKHCGVQLTQHQDHSVTIDHASFCEELKQMSPIKGERKLTPEEVSQVRAILGSIQWRVYQSAPHHAAKLNYLQSLIASQDSSIVEQVNKLVREVFAARSLSVQVQALGTDNPEDLCMIGWSDASLANRPDLSSTGGYLIALMHKDAIQQGIGRVNPVSWRSGKLHRVARSSLSAETQALADAEQELFYSRLSWREMIGDEIKGTLPEEVSRRVPGYLVVDAKAMYDSLSKGVLVASQKDKYTGLELFALGQHLDAQQTTLLWCDSDHQLADGLTKASKQDVLKCFLSSGTWRIRYDGAYISAKKRKQMALGKLAELGDLSALEEALSRGDADVNWRRPKDGNAALHLAAEWGHLEVVQLLLDSRADPELHNNYSMSPFALAAHGSDVENLLAKVTRPLAEDRRYAMKLQDDKAADEGQTDTSGSGRGRRSRRRVAASGAWSADPETVQPEREFIYYTDRQSWNEEAEIDTKRLQATFTFARN
eukprot:s5262_g8.t1